MTPDGIYTSQIITSFKENFDLFKEACGSGETIEKIELSIKDVDLYYQKYIINKNFAKSKAPIRALIDRGKRIFRKK